MPNATPLHPVATDLWQLRKDLHLPGGVRLPATMTVLRLPNGEIVLHSPVRLDDTDADAIAALGPVTQILAPNRYHHLYLASALRRWPDALVHGAPGLATKRKDIEFHSELGDTPPPALAEVLDQVVVEGAPMLNEVVWLHRPSRTLVTTDLVFHVREPMCWQTRLALKTMGTHDRLAQSRWWRWYTRDRDLWRQSVERLLAWDFERVTMSHGTTVACDAAGLRQALWMLER